MKHRKVFSIVLVLVLTALLVYGVAFAGDYPSGECVRYARDRANALGWNMPWFEGWDGYALNWDNTAPKHGFYVGEVPRGGAIAVWEKSKASVFGHVAFVERVNEDGSIYVSERNVNFDGQDGTRVLPRDGAKPDSYIYAPYPIVYEHINYAGKWEPLRGDRSDLALQLFQYGDGPGGTTPIYIGDQISSVWVPPNWSVQLFEHANFATDGSRLGPFSVPIPNLSSYSFNDKTSSAKVFEFACPAGGIVNFAAGSGSTATANTDRPPVQMAVSEIGIQANGSGICGVGPSNPSNPSNPPSAPDTSQWQLSFYNNEGTSGSPVWTGTDGSGGINHNWGSGSPASGVNADHFSARWERDVNFPTSGDWKFTIRSDDGFRIFIDGELFSHEWSAGWHDISPSKYLTAGIHRIRLDYFDATGGAQVSFSWQGPPNNDGNNHGSWFAEWFNWDDLDPAKRISTSSENQINYDWHEGSPGHGLGTDNFSVRWTGTFYFDEDWFYKFPVKSDDGFKLWIDGQLVGQEWYEGWHDVAPDRRLSAGNHQVVYEYFEKYGGANTRLTWYKLPPDTTPPVGQIIQPAGGITINANQVKICAQVEDAGVGLGTVQFQLYHLAEPDAWRVLGNDDDGRDGYCKTWDHSQWPDEEINTYIFAWDRAGNMLSGGGNTFRIDRTAPTGSFASPTSNSTITTNNLTIRVNANDNLSNGVDRVEFQGYYDAGNDNLGWWPMTVDSTGADGWGFDWDLSDLPNQTITMRATIYDKAGNSRTIEANNVAIVPRPPSEHVELTNVSTQVSGEYRTEFNPGESFSLWIGATNHVAEPVDTLWTWEVTNPNGSVNGGLSWKDFPVSMSPGANAWALNRTAPTTPGTYTFVGKITWGDGQYRSQKSMTFRVAGSSTIYLPIIVK